MGRTGVGFALVLAGASGCEGESKVRNDSQGGGSAGSGAGTGGDVAGNAGGGASSGGAGTAGAGIAGGGAGGATAGSAGVGGIPGLPPPATPLGVFGEVVDRLVRARTDAIQALCCSAFCCDDPEELVNPIACLGEEYPIFLPPAGWFACASRLAATEAEVSTYLSMQAACYESCAGEARGSGCDEQPGNVDSCSACRSAVEPEALGACEASNAFTECPSGPLVEPATTGRICNGQTECADGTDELNCDPTARSFRCTSGETVPWLSLCDGTAACTDASDEFACVTPSF